MSIFILPNLTKMTQKFVEIPKIGAKNVAINPAVPVQGYILTDKSETPSKTIIEKIKDNLPGVVSILIVLGYLDIHFYYKQFGISIHQYLDASEIIFSVANLAIIAIPILFYVGLLAVRITKGEPKLNLKFWKIDDRAVVLILLAGLVAILFFFITINSLHEDYVTGLWFLGVVGLFSLIHMIFERWKEDNKTFLTIKLICFLLTFVLAQFLLNMIKANRLLELKQNLENQKYNVTLIRGTTTIDTDADTLFIGATKGFIFLRKINRSDREKDQNIIIPRSEVKEFMQQKYRSTL